MLNRRFDKDSTQSSHYTSAAQPRLSPLLQGFLAIPSKDYKACETYCRNNPKIWTEDRRELQRLTLKYLSENRNEYARRCAERWLMLKIAEQGNFSDVAASNYLKGLVKGGDDAFQNQLDTTMGSWSKEEEEVEAEEGEISADQVALTTRSGSRLSGANVSPKATRYKDSTGNETNLTKALKNIDLNETKLVMSTEHGRRKERGSQKGTLSTPSSEQAHNRRSSSFGQDNSRASRGDTESVLTVGLATLHEVTRRERGINSSTEGVGPDSSIIGKDNLNAAYKIRTGPDAVLFFVKGRVFAMVWHENAGSSLNPNSTATSEQWERPFHRYTRTKDGVVIFSHIRRFVIVQTKKKRRYCLAIPINSYGEQGLTKPGMRMDEKQAHAIVHASGSEPMPLEGEVELQKEPIAVDMAPGENLSGASRIHFGKMQSIDWNVKVKDVGLITGSTNLRRLINYFNAELRSGDDTSTETEAERSRR